MNLNTMLQAKEIVDARTVEISSDLLCKKPKVTVCVITYRHVNFIREAVESVLCQETDFEFEVVIGDDGSDDGTGDILKDLQRRHPNQIRLLLATENLGKYTGNGRLNMLRTLWAARGPYLAMLEGDDFWTDPTKLKRQYKAFAEHPSWSLCFHVAEYVDESGKPIGTVHPKSCPNEMTPKDIVINNYVHTCSIMLRMSVIESLPDGFLRYPVGDWPLCVIASLEGNLGFLDRAMCAYRVHQAGLWTNTPKEERYLKAFQMYLQLMVDFPSLRAICEEQILTHISDLHHELDTIKSSRSWKVMRSVTQSIDSLRNPRGSG